MNSPFRQALVHLGFLSPETLQKLGQRENLESYLLQNGQLTPGQLRGIQKILEKGYLFCSSCQRGFNRPANKKGLLPCPQCNDPLELYPKRQSQSQFPTPSGQSKGESPTVTEEIVTPPPREVSLSKGDEVDISAFEHTLPSELREKFPGSYHVLRVLGQGGYGVVYEVQDPLSPRQIALKVLRGQKAIRETTQKRFRREIQISSYLEHPNIIPVYNSGYLEDGSLYYSMKKLRGGTLRDLLREKEREVEIEELIELFLKVCDALDYAHSQGVIHRDLKPGNIAVDSYGEVLVLDWGIARCKGIKGIESVEDQRDEEFEIPSTEGLEEELTLTGSLMGTPGFMSPEQARGEEVDGRSDIFALGAIFYEILCRKPAMEGNKYRRLTLTLLEDPPPPHEVTERNIPRELSAIAMKCMAKKREDRYETVGELKEDILRYRRGYGVTAKKDNLFQKSWRWMARNKAVSLGAAAVVFTLVISLFVFRQNREWKRQKKIQHYWQKVSSIESKMAPKKKKLKVLEGRSGDQKSQIVRRLREELLNLLTEAKISLERALELAPQREKFQEKLWKLEREIGHLALKDRNYLLSQTSFKRGKSLGYEKEAARLLKKVEKSRQARRQSQLQRIDEIVSTLKKGPPAPGMIDEYVSEISRMEGGYVVKKLLPLIYHKNEFIRKVAIESLGKIGDPHTELKGKPAVIWLTEKLDQTRSKEKIDEAVALVWALGRMRDSRAYSTVFDTRLAWGQNSNFWYRTEIPFRWIPGSKSPRQTEEEILGKKGIEEHLRGNHKRAYRILTETIKKHPQESDLYLNRAGVLTEIGEWEKAIGDYKKALELAPEEKKEQILVNLADAHRRMENYREALAALKNVNRDDKQILRARDIRGMVYRDMGRYKKALKEFNWTLSKKPENTKFLVNRANVYMEMRKYHLALEDLNLALEKNPETPEILATLSRVYKRMGKLEKALIYASRALRINPQDPIIYNNRATLYLSLGRLDKSLADLKQALKIDPKNKLAVGNLPLVYYKKGKIEKARQLFLKALSLYPKDLKIRKQWIKFLINIKEYSRAKKACRNLSQLHPKSYELYLLKGFLYSDTGKLQQALDYYDQALKIKPRDWGTLSDRGLLLQSLGRPKEALESYNQALKINPQSWKTLCNRGRLLTGLGQWDQAAKDFEKVLEINPNLADAHSSLGVIYYRRKKYNKSLEHLNRALEISPQNFLALRNRAEIHRHLKKSERALRDYNRALAIKGKDIATLLGRGKLYYFQYGHYERAKRDYLKILEINPRHSKALYHLAPIYHRQGKFRKALQCLEKVLDVDPHHPQAERAKKLIQFYKKKLEESK